MRKHSIRRLSSVVAVVTIAFLLLIGFTDVVYAGTTSRQRVVGQMVMGTRALEYLIGGQCSIEPASGGTIMISGITLANQIVERIGIVFYLQVYNNISGTWEEVESWPFSKTSASSIESSMTTSAQHGKTYRVRALHEVWNTGGHESGWSVTPEILIP